MKTNLFPAEKLQETKLWFPHVYNKLELFWGEPEFDNFISSLIVTQRESVRQGFPVEIMNELLSVHTHTMPAFSKWDENNKII